MVNGKSKAYVVTIITVIYHADHVKTPFAANSFLWKVEAFPPGDNFRVGPIVRSYRWTARNDYIILSDSSFLSVGGGYVVIPSYSSLLCI